MKNNLSNTTSGQIAKMAAPIFALFLSLTASAFPQTSGLNAIPAVAVSPSGMPTPQGVKVLAQVPLGGQPVTRMYTQWESGHTYLYIEHGRQQLTAVDVTRKRNPQVVTHAPAKAEAARYEELAEGGTIEVSSPSQVNAGLIAWADAARLAFCKTTVLKMFRYCRHSGATAATWQTATAT